MTRIPRQRFSRSDIEALFVTDLEQEDFDLDDLLLQLFYSGAIANYIPGRREDYVQFYHRRSHSDLNVSGPFLLHNALTIGLNVPR